MIFELRQYQIDAVEALRQNLRDGVIRQVLCAPTGSGKTEIAMNIVEEASKKGSRVYFICDRQTLVNQTSQRFLENGISHGVLMGASSKYLWNDLLICSSQTLESRGFGWRRTSNSWDSEPRIAQNPDLVIIDECHEIRKKIVDYVKEKGIRAIGLSATPFSPVLRKYYETLVNVTTTQDLITDGFLSPLKIVAAKNEVDVEGLKLNTNGEWVRRDVSDRVMQITGHIVPEWEKQTQKYFNGPQPTIVFCPSVADSEDVAQKFQEAGYDFRVVHYKQSAEEKQRRVDAFKEGRHLGLISCVALTKGFDAPETQCLVDAYPLRKSLAMHIQKIGRVMRIARDKDFGLVIDHAGNWLGFYDATHAFFESGQKELPKETDKQAVRKKKEETAHLTCKSCGYIFPPGEDAEICPACGATRRRKRGRLQVLEGELGEIDVVDKKGRKLPFNGNWWDEICKVACRIARNKMTGRIDTTKAKKMAFARYRAIFGKWPDDPFLIIDEPCRSRS